MNFKIFLLIFLLSIFLSKYPPIFSDISDISVKSKYRYIRNYRYFVPWLPCIWNASMSYYVTCIISKSWKIIFIHHISHVNTSTKHINMIFTKTVGYSIFLAIPHKYSSQNHITIRTFSPKPHKQHVIQIVLEITHKGSTYGQFFQQFTHQHNTHSPPVVRVSIPDCLKIVPTPNSQQT